MSEQDKDNLMPTAETPTHRLEIGTNDGSAEGVYLNTIKIAVNRLHCFGDRQEAPCPACGKDELRVSQALISVVGPDWSIERQCHACYASDTIPYKEQRAHPSIRIPRERAELERIAELLLSYPDLTIRIGEILEKMYWPKGAK